MHVMRMRLTNGKTNVNDTHINFGLKGTHRRGLSFRLSDRIPTAHNKIPNTTLPCTCYKKLYS